MTQTLAPRRTSPLVVLTGVVGLLAGVASSWLAFLFVAYGGLVSDGWFTVLTLCQVGAGVLGLWGAVRLLRRRGWRMVAVGSVLGLYPFSVRVHNAVVDSLYGFGADTPGNVYELVEAVGVCLPPLVLLLVLLPPVRRAAVTTSGV